MNIHLQCSIIVYFENHSLVNVGPILVVTTDDKPGSLSDCEAVGSHSQATRAREYYVVDKKGSMVTQCNMTLYEHTYKNHKIYILLCQVFCRLSVVVFNCWNGLTNCTLVVPVFPRRPIRLFTTGPSAVGYPVRIRTPVDGVVNQKHNCRDRIAVALGYVYCGGFDLRVSNPHDGDSIL